MSEQAEATTCARTPWRLWACGAGYPGWREGDPVWSLPCPRQSMPNEEGLTLVHQN